MAGRVLDHVAVEVGHRPARLDHGIDVLRAEQAVEAAVAAGLVRQQIGLAVVRRRAERRALRAVDADADEVGERLARIRRRPRSPRASRRRTRSGCRSPCSRGWCSPSRRRRSRSPARVYGTHGAGAILPFSLIISGVVSVGAAGRVEERRRPVGERDAGAGRAVGLEVAEAVRDRLAHPVGVDAGERRQDAGRRVRDQRRVVVRQQRAVALDEVEQVRHLLEVRRHVRVVAPEVGVVELDVDDVLECCPWPS